jgi:IS5 family transposase
LLLKSHHDLPHERSGLARWRNRLGDWFEAVLAESLRIAHDSGAQKARRLWGGSR